MEQWTRFVLRHRRVVLLVWLVVLVLGGIATVRIAPLLSNNFSVPGTPSARARTALAHAFGEKPEGTFTLVFQARHARDSALLARLDLVAARAARRVGGRATPVEAASAGVAFGLIETPLDLSHAKRATPALQRLLGTPPGVEHAYVTGGAAIQSDLDPIFAADLRKGESIAVPIALLVLLAVFGFSAAVTMPFVFAACTITASLGVMYWVARAIATPTYVTNLIELVGLGIAIDYSLLVVHRFREELARGLDKDDAIVETMRTSGRAIIFSGATVTIGLIALIAVPVPFMRMMGVAGFLIPVMSVLAALTLQPTLLSLYGPRGVAARFAVPVRAGFWARLAASIMRRPLLYLAVGGTVLVAAAVPAIWIQLTPGSSFGIPRTPPAIHGFDVLRGAVGTGALSPIDVVVVGSAPAATARLSAELQRDPEIERTLPPRSSNGDTLVEAYGRHDYGTEAAQQFVHRLRSQLIPAARFPAQADVLTGGAPAQGVDFLDRSYAYFPWLILAVLALTYLVLLRAFRSVVLPLKAVLLNVLSVGASYGMLVVIFRWHVGHDVAWLYPDAQVEGWIPIFLFAMLFGLSMDYEVFLVSRMREAWDNGADNATAVAHGLERTGRIITAAAVIMVAAFSGFLAGRIVGLQEFGMGLAVAVLLDATVVRSLLVPSLMAVFGRWNWWLPPWLARVLRVSPS
ncbi:MAG TPA: MMPL family transporter [Gaiellaceae bacterium]|nr:MMPL family transporter [Gaiellaceae bacterium]